MATTAFGVNHPLAVKVWAKKLFVEALKETYAKRFMSTGTNSLIQVKPELNKGAGDKITYGLRVQLTSAGVQGDNTLEGNEDGLATYADSLYIDQLRNAVRSDGKMTEQRVPFSIREEARSALSDWWSGRLDQSFMNQISGNTLQGDTRFTGNNATIAASTKVMGVNAAADESISTTDIMTLTKIDYAYERAVTQSPMIRPVRVDGKNMYVAFVTPTQATDLRVSTTTGQWLDIQKSVVQGGKADSNPIFTDSMGSYHDTILHVSTRLPSGIAAAGTAVANTARAVFCGAQSAVFAYGKDQEGAEMDWVEESYDYKNQLGVSSGMIFGMKKTRFNSVDFGVIVIPTYALAH